MARRGWSLAAGAAIGVTIAACPGCAELQKLGMNGGSTSAPAAPSAGSAEAAELFKQGRAALEAKDYATACPKFSASLRLERAVGTLISLAECEQATSKLASARQHWQEAADFADASGDALQRGDYARQKFAQIDKRVPRLILHLASAAPSDTSVLRDSVDLGATSFDVPLPVDPGVHTVVASAPNHEANTFSVNLKEGEQKKLEIAPGNTTTASAAPISASPSAPASPAEAAAGPAPPPETAPTPPPQASPAPVTPSSPGGTLRRVGLVTAGVGVLSLGAGTFFGLRAIGKKNDADCSANRVCPSTAAAGTFRDGTAAANLSTVFFVAGSVLTATGVTLYFLAPKQEDSPAGRLRIAPSVAGEGPGMTVFGTW